MGGGHLILEKKKLHLSDKLLAGLLIMIIVAITCQITWRYVFNNSLSWTEEISKYLYAWLIFIGAASAIRMDSHIKVDILSAKLKGKAKKLLSAVHYILLIFVQSYLLYYGIDFVIKTKGSYSTALALPMNIVVNTSLPIACLIGIIISISKMVMMIKNMDEPFERKG
jgi:TRAP-type C4-dicarboxylate transport system permease small subunit